MFERQRGSKRDKEKTGEMKRGRREGKEIYCEPGCLAQNPQKKEWNTMRREENSVG